jgi:dienelactone hydrolase
LQIKRFVLIFWKIIPINVEISYADHGFFNDEHPACHPEAAREAWGMVRVVFKNKFGLAGANQ